MPMSKASSTPMLPKISLRLLIGVVTLSGVAMAIFQQAIAHHTTWAVMAMAAILALVTPFLLYVGSFSLASLFSTVGAVAAGDAQQQRVHTPTQWMPGQVPTGSAQLGLIQHGLTLSSDGGPLHGSETESSDVTGAIANTKTEADH